MRGSIIKEVILVLLFFGVLLTPMIRLTRTPEVLQPIEELTPLEVLLLPTWLTIRFAHQPVAFEILAGQHSLWSMNPADAIKSDREIALYIPESLIELNVRVVWPAGTPQTVCELTLEPDGLATQSLTVWGEGTLDEIMTFSWKTN
ncbi:MAG: hypothetical protein ACI9QL_002183 [Candidatus Omnitrophota bacterium]|jgi:hypothetical protein